MKEVASFLGTHVDAGAETSYVDPRVVDAYARADDRARTTRRTSTPPDERQAALERATPS